MRTEHNLSKRRLLSEQDSRKQHRRLLSGGSRDQRTDRVRPSAARAVLGHQDGAQRDVRRLLVRRRDAGEAGAGHTLRERLTHHKGGADVSGEGEGRGAGAHRLR